MTFMAGDYKVVKHVLVTGKTPRIPRLTGAGKKIRLLILAMARVVHFATQANGDEQVNIVLREIKQLIDER
jgi:hypothetical protein